MNLGNRQAFLHRPEGMQAPVMIGMVYLKVYEFIYVYN